MPGLRPQLMIDWIVATLRWFILVGVGIALARIQPFNTVGAVVLLLAGVWNVLLTLPARINPITGAYRPLSLAGDFLVAHLVFYLSGGLVNTLAWVGILPVITAAMFYDLRTALFTGLLSLAVMGPLAAIHTPPGQVVITLATLAALYLALALLATFLKGRLVETTGPTEKTRPASRRDPALIEIERRRAIYNLITALSASLNYQRVLDTALDLSISALTTSNTAAEKVVSAVLLFAKEKNQTPELHVGSARRFTPADLRICLPGSGGLIGRAIDSGESRLSKNIANDPELSRIVALRTCVSAYCIPLRTGLDTYGVLLFAHPEADFFNPDMREVLDIVGNQSVVAITNARLYQDLEIEKERMLEIQEEARKKMARDLHDGPTQSVSAIAMRINFARRLIERDVGAAAEELFKIEDMARRTTKEIRHMLFTLRPLVLESQGLLAALESMAEKMHETYEQNVIVQADPAVIEQLEMGKQAVVFYIAEEAISNARKHAKAEHIWVRLKPLKDELALLEIEDDGVGFNPGDVEASYETRGSLGMVNMRERTELVNGVFHIDAAKGKGSRIQVFLPLTEEALERIRRGL